ncbi:hypothetical protein, partial [Providencia stuartii]|uniref:hypothetical protein n=1 Tax=Providencia stuartii TaxID=588 RepID=UPI0019538EFB
LGLLADEAATQQARAAQLRQRVAAGLADRRESLAADGARARAEAEHAQAQAALHAHLAALAVLAGRSPADRDAWRDALLAPADLPRV